MCSSIEYRRAVRLHPGLAIVLTRFARHEGRHAITLPIMRLRPILFALSIVVASAPARAAELAPFKDDLFAYSAILSSADGGDYRVVDYRELRDINERDEVPERRVKRDYVSLGVRSAQQDLKLKSDAGDVRFVAVGKHEGAAIITVYLHGKGGSRKQGVDDFTFGGNFNRIKNLMADNDGLYLSPDFSDFDDKGTAEVAALIEHYAGGLAGREGCSSPAARWAALSAGSWRQTIASPRVSPA